jgi:HD superfamily phosphodiesterase
MDKTAQKLNDLYANMIEYFAGDAKRVQHFVKVHSFAKLIGQNENLDKDVLTVLEAAAFVHDIGIKTAEEVCGRCDGKLQEKYGPAEAEKILKKSGFEEAEIARISYLVGHHHTYSGIEGLDYQILVEADFLVNFYEDGCDRQTILATLQKVFKTDFGKHLCRVMFSV